ncbi:MAG: hypothetical protein Q9171_007055 [Xanthocarpia ochracea]
MTDAKTPSPTPSPFSWAPSQWWDGYDGQWSSFDLRVGTPEQTVRVLPSTAGSATWIVTPGGCEPPSSECSIARGGLFNQTQSSTWNDLGLFTLTLEQNLGHNESGAFGLDTISLGLSNATGGPILDSQIIAGIETERWYTGVFGLQQQPMNLTDFSQPQQSFLSALRSQNLIPSLSWAYTAGAHYRSKGSFGSLTLGGSDISKYVPTNVSFSLAPDVGRDLVVGIKSITSTYINGSVGSLLPSPTLAFIDSTVPYLYLPVDACKAFESELGLVYNQKKNFYFVDDALHQTLSNSMPQFNFRLANDKSSEPTVEITLPYASFDLIAKPPLTPNATRYFPLRRGADHQITLGRAFLQEAYVITDYDQKNFTVAQTLFNDIAKPNIVPIPWNATAVPGGGKRLTREASIGISTGSVVFGLLLILLVTFLTLRWRKRRPIRALTDTAINSQDFDEIRPFSFIPTYEIGHQSIPELHDIGYQPELLNGLTPSGSGKVLDELADGTKTPVHELFVPATRISNELPSRMGSKPSADTTTIKSGSWGDGVTGMPTGSPQADPRNMKRATSGSTYTHLGINLNKALPHKPFAKAYTKGYRSSRRSLPGVQVLPTTNSAENHPSAYADIPTALSPRMSPVPTYASVFDIEEYKDSAIVSEKQQGSF